MRGLALLIVVLAAGCSVTSTADEGSTTIRIRNTSSVTFDALTVGFPTMTVQYGSLAPGETTTYRNVGKVYRYAQVSITSNDRNWTLQPVDYVGEAPLGSGEWTYEITLEPEREALSIRAVRD